MRRSTPSPFGNTFRCLCLLLLAASDPAAGAFGFADVSRLAQQLAAKPHRPPEAKLPAALRDIGYDDYRAIRFRTERSLWRGSGLPFEVQFFHPGFLFQQTVRINLVTASGVRPYPFDPGAFNYGKVTLDRKALRKLGYAGFRIHYPLNRKDYKDEITVFLGASYFRGVGKRQQYGLSARGLAVDTALPSGEEMPFFREFWIEWPAPDASQIAVHALLDSRRVTGAYRFVIRPGAATAMDVKARLFLREPVGKLGLAPLSSMYFFGENQPAPHEDYRPEVHDSDGLSIASGNGEWLWRPLTNPRRLLVTSFALRDPRGFGLLQRDRLFVHYEDPETRYDVRPGAWIEPQGDWGPGRIELVQIPTRDEFNDNIVAYWVPDRAPEPRRPFDLAYRVHWQMENQAAPPSARVVQTRRSAVDKDTVRFLIDFAGPALDEQPPETELDADAWCGARSANSRSSCARSCAARRARSAKPGATPGHRRERPGSAPVAAGAPGARARRPRVRPDRRGRARSGAPADDAADAPRLDEAAAPAAQPVPAAVAAAGRPAAREPGGGRAGRAAARGAPRRGAGARCSCCSSRCRRWRRRCSRRRCCRITAATGSSRRCSR